MAHIDHEENASGRSKEHEQGHDGFFSRRNYLKLTGAAVVGSAGSTAAMSGSVAAATGGPILQGLFHDSSVSIGEFEQWCGRRTAVVVRFADMFALDAQSFVQQQLLPIWNYDHVPLLTLEPWGQGSNVEKEIANGQHDGTLHDWADAIHNYVHNPDGPNRQIYIRFAHEMNGDWYPWAHNPYWYKQMWRHFRPMVMNGVNQNHVRFIWCVNSDDTTEHSAEAFYPGDNHVSWVGVDGYNFGGTQSWSSWTEARDIFEGMVGRVRSKSNGKPVAVPEFASTSYKQDGRHTGAKGQWIHNAYEYLANDGIRLAAWFEQQKETDWPVFSGDHRYTAYDNEMSKDRIISGQHPLTNDQFAGRF